MMLGAPNVKAMPVKIGGLSPVMLIALAAASYWFFRKKRR